MTVSAQATIPHAAISAEQALLLRCPVCAAVLGDLELARLNKATRYLCSICSFAITYIDEIWRALQPKQIEQIESSLSAYESVRKAEGRWSERPDFYLALPWRDLTGCFSRQWQIRARSFQFLQRRILPALISTLDRESLRILDLGAGNSWMSYRLAQMGHIPIALDISTSPLDGLGAARHYRERGEQPLICFHAAMDRLPFASEQFDLAIYNASFHYAHDYTEVLREAKRVLRPGGAVVIIDSPTYCNEADGEAMVREKHEEFARRFGTGRGSMDGLEYLTPDRVARLELLGIRWTRYSPWYGVRWAARPLMAQLAGRRTPSRFHIYLGVLAQNAPEAR